MHGLTGGGWKRSVGHGHRSEAARRGNPGKSGCGTYRRATSPRQPPTLLRYGVSKATFSAVDQLAWGRLMRWIRRKYKRGHHRIGMKELRRRFCDQGWRFAHNGVVFTGAASVTVTRYRYRGSTIPTPWTPAPALG